MPFLLRVTEIPPLSQIVQIEQIVIVDQAGPAITFGVGSRVACVVGEFLKGPFVPTEVFSQGDLASLFVGDTTRALTRISQSALGTGYVQDGSAGAFDGNGWAELKGKKFTRLVVQRVDCDAVTLSAGSVKCAVEFAVTIGTAETDGSVTSKDIVIPAGTRFGDDTTAALATVIVATSQDITIPAGTTIVSGQVLVDQTFDNGNDTAGATVFFVKGVTASSGVIDSVFTDDRALPNVSSATIIATSSIRTIDTTTGVASAAFAPKTGTTLGDRITACYPDAIAKIAPSRTPTTDITETWSARNWAADAAGLIAGDIRAPLWQDAISASQTGRGRVACGAAEPANGSTTAAASAALSAALALPAAEFASVDADREFLNFPYVAIFSSELQQNILVSPAGFKAEMCNNLATEFQTSVPNTFMTAIVGLEPAFENNPLSKASYIALKAAGVSGVINDRTTGWQFQSAVTAVNPVTYSNRVADNRRRFADEVQDTITGLAAKYNKFPGTTERVDALVGEIETYLASLVSADVPPLQRAEAYSVDATSGNTPTLTAAGVRVFQIAVRMLGDLNDLVFIVSVGPTVVINQTT